MRFSSSSSHSSWRGEGEPLWEPLEVSGFPVPGPTVIRWCWVLRLEALAFLGRKDGATLSSGGHLRPGEEG